ncbi:MAG: leucine-rich repeat domain-containing protein, partial [Bdellovibrionales bacterium]|nr:leucine-rich repeat domain-containing protein [Bdellovibrionales bacterium]
MDGFKKAAKSILRNAIVKTLNEIEKDNLEKTDVVSREAPTTVTTVTISATSATGGILTKDIVKSNIGGISNTTPISVVIEGFEVIDETAFHGLSNLVQVTIPNTVTTIGAPASRGLGPFFMCRKLNKVIFEENSQLTIIGNTAFSGCSALKSITIPPTVTYIGLGAFQSTGLTSITIPPLVTTMNEGFSYCPDLETVTFKGNSALTSVNNQWFKSSTNLKTIYATPATLKKWGIEAGENNKSFGGPDDGVTIIETEPEPEPEPEP